jgi:hypothetical protein
MTAMRYVTLCVKAVCNPPHDHLTKKSVISSSHLIAIKQIIKASTEQKQHELILIFVSWSVASSDRPPPGLSDVRDPIDSTASTTRSRESLVLSRFIQISKREDSFISRSILQGEPEHEQERRRCVEKALDAYRSKQQTANRTPLSLLQFLKEYRTCNRVHPVYNRLFCC